MASKALYAGVRIPLAWTHRRRLMRVFVLACCITAVLLLVTLPLIWVDAVLWLISLAAVLVSLILIVKSKIVREEAADIARNGPFIEISLKGIRLPERLAAPGRPLHSTDLSTISFESWRTVPKLSQGTHYPADAFLSIKGELDLLLVASNDSGVIGHLQQVSWDASAERCKGRRRIEVDQARLVEAEAYLRASRDARNADRLARVTEVLQKNAIEAAATQPVQAPAPASDPVKEAAADVSRRESLARLAKQDAARAAALAAANAPLDVDNIQSRLFTGKLLKVPREFRAHVRDWRDRGGNSLLHLRGSNKAVEALLAAGVDPTVRDKEGRTALMVDGRSADANRMLIEAGTPLDAVANNGQNALQYQAAGHDPNFEGIQVLIDAGLPPPTRAEAAEWKDNASREISSGAEHNAWTTYCAWLDKIAK